MLITGYTLEFVNDFTSLDREDMWNAGNLKHFADLWELLNIDIIENDLAAMLVDFLLHKWFEDLARTAP
jgi:hypothetical protein